MSANDPFLNTPESGAERSDAPAPPPAAPPAPGYAAPGYVAHGNSAPGYAPPSTAPVTYGAPGYPPGYGGPGYPPLGPAGGTEKNWLGIVALVCAFVAPVAGVVFGHLAMSANTRGEARNRGVSFAGLLLSYVLIAALWLYIALLLSFIPFVSIVVGGIVILCAVWGLVLGVRMRGGRTRRTYTSMESGWTLGASATMAVAALVPMTLNMLFLTVWSAIPEQAQSGGSGEFSSNAAAPAVADSSGGIPVGSGGVAGGEIPGDAVRVDIYLDFMCPICGDFEEVNGDDLAALRDSGDIELVYHPISILDSYSMGTDYSTRSAAAAASIAEYSPEHFVDFVDALFAQQPAEMTEGLSDEQLQSIAEAVGVASDVAARITDGEFSSWVTYATDQASQDGVAGTPTVMVNGIIENSVELPYFNDGVLGAYLRDLSGSAHTNAAPRVPTSPSESHTLGTVTR